MPIHRVIVIGLIVAFLLVVAVDYWRKRHLPKTKMVIDSRDNGTAPLD